MPTTRMRHMITETDEIRAAIDEAALAWPDQADNRAELLRRLVLQGSPSALEVEARRRLDFLSALSAVAGSLPRVYPADAAQRLAEEWPE